MEIGVKTLLTNRKIQVDGLTKVFIKSKERVMALEDIDFSIKDGEFVCILGPSGCGKTTLLRILAGLEKPSSGEFNIN